MTEQQPTEGTPLTEQQLAEIRAVAQRAEARPFLLSDREGELKVWAVSALKHVVRNESGEITGWSEPFLHPAADLVAEVSLGSIEWVWFQAEDQQRRDIGDLVDARAALPALLADNERLRVGRDQFADRVDTLTAVAKGNKRHVQALTEDLDEAQRRHTADTAELKRRITELETAATTARAEGNLIRQRDAIELTVLDWENGKVDADSALKMIDRIIQGDAQ